MRAPSLWLLLDHSLAVVGSLSAVVEVVLVSISGSACTCFGCLSRVFALDDTDT